MPAMTLVLGVGNLLMGDEGVGVHAIAALDREHWPDHVILLDGGTGGFHLLGYIHDFGRIVMIDATLDGQPAGTVTTLYPKYAAQFPRSLSAHDIGLKDLLESAEVLGPLPQITLLTVSIDVIRPMDLNLSDAVSAAVPEVCRRVRTLVDHHHHAEALGA